MGAQQPYEEYADSRGLWSRVRERVFGLEDVEEVDDEDEPVQAVVHAEPRRRANLRVETARTARVAIRMGASGFNDARTAADGLKGGQQQIINLEKAPPQMAERIVDFLSGVTYALDGTVDKIGEKVYLFAPASVQIEVDEGVSQQRTEF